MIECRVLKQTEEGEVEVEFTMERAKPTTRTFKEMQSATVFASFLAAQAGMRDKQSVGDWVADRGFDRALVPDSPQ